MSTAAALDRSRPAPSTLPLFYFGFAHACLFAALSAFAVSPSTFAEFFYHPRMLATVHLVTLGWITSHILGALYLIAPMALRTRLRITRTDQVAFWIYAVGVVGMVGHFWIGETRGMVWAAILVLATIVLIGTRTHEALRTAPIDGGVKLHYRLAFLNVVGAGTLGILLALHRIHPFLRSEPLGNLFAHVHLAALGWATMTVFGSAQRLLPMLLPSALPPSSRAWMSAALLEVGTIGLVACFLAAREWLPLFAAIAAAAVAWFLGLVVWMLRHRRRPGPGLPRFDPTRLYALQALLYLTLTAVLGMALAIAPRSVETLRLAKVYGVTGLLGFMGTMILGVAGRHVPVLFWTRTVQSSGAPPSRSPYRLRPPALQILELATWSLGVPLLGLALWIENAATLRTAAVLLLAAVVTSALNHLRSWRRAAATA